MKSFRKSSDAGVKFHPFKTCRMNYTSWIHRFNVKSRMFIKRTFPTLSSSQVGKPPFLIRRGNLFSLKHLLFPQNLDLLVWCLKKVTNILIIPNGGETWWMNLMIGSLKNCPTKTNPEGGGVGVYQRKCCHPPPPPKKQKPFEASPSIPVKNHQHHNTHRKSIWPNGIIFHQPGFPWNSRGPISRNLNATFWGQIGRVRSL